MIITAIRRHVRSSDRYSVYVDEAYAFSLSADVLLGTGIVVGQELDAVQLQKYKKLSADDKAYNLALRYVARRLRSRYEFREYCKRKGYDDELTQTITQKLVSITLLDDKRFAEAWVQTRRLLKPVSKRRLQLELRQKHVAETIIEQVLAGDEIDDQTVLVQLITHKRRQLRYRDDTKLMQYLARQGFGYDAIKAALTQVSESV